MSMSILFVELADMCLKTNVVGAGATKDGEDAVEVAVPVVAVNRPVGVQLGTVRR